MTWPEPPSYYDPPKVGYKVILQQPAFPIVYPDPNIGQVLGNMRMSSWGLATGMALTGGALGYWKGSQRSWQRPGMFFGMFLLGKTGLAWGLIDSSYRLMGYKENDREVQTNLPGLLLRRETYV
mmetsp:Transcript_10708/g.18636  ORF Transcript_10708/g.18636 Transcript_10708/m.18636 type:complete len:124 (-) Transcript_10708:421-792(-)|eukprot:CAMPEP_0119109462 /NCGR_PEP_ID=MMETSP1180-20130426/17918_1 /TAXON_ID=3052 ORGANISM="Chlamydomonas cf sp, Strain CCMP681" /NCGR_SAMPLE_ID=MMETSP1180 /ASSEMBLY_ACC=CAM_ASM_000741 /LENGTH=123 /DNA_ID=CAMNT_0007095219 /DNA_START=40 /DNA_END=411 /DNA_ORIENTATION=+